MPEAIRSFNDIFLTISLADYATLHDKKPHDFRAVGVRHSEHERVWAGGGEPPPIDRLERSVRQAFFKKLPKGTVVVVSLQTRGIESTAGVFTDGRQTLCHRGTALIPKS